MFNQKNRRGIGSAVYVQRVEKAHLSTMIVNFARNAVQEWRIKMTKKESLRILDKCIECLDSLSDDEIDKLANEANEYMIKPLEKAQRTNGNNDKFVPSDKTMNTDPIIDTIDSLTCGFLDTYDIEPYMNTIMESLKKQMPQKVTHEATLMRDTTCPCCKNVVGSYIDFNGVKTRVQYQYCCYCGQALDWQGDKNDK